MSKIGTTKLTAGVMLAVALFNQTKETLEDGSFQPMEAFKFIDELTQLPEVIQSASEMRDEINDLDHAEREELEAKVAKSLNIAREDVAEVVTDAIDWIFGSYKLVSSLRSVVSKNEAGS